MIDQNVTSEDLDFLLKAYLIAKENKGTMLVPDEVANQFIDAFEVIYDMCNTKQEFFCCYNLLKELCLNDSC